MKEKKGDIAIGTVISVVLGLVVLVIIILVVRQQVTKGASKYSEIGEQATIKQDTCTSFIMGRVCSNNACDINKGYKEKFPPTGEWTDCGSGKHCCESI